MGAKASVLQQGLPERQNSTRDQQVGVLRVRVFDVMSVMVCCVFICFMLESDHSIVRMN